MEHHEWQKQDFTLNYIPSIKGLSVLPSSSPFLWVIMRKELNIWKSLLGMNSFLV